LAVIGVVAQQGTVCPTIVGTSYNGIAEYDGPGATTASIRLILPGATWPVPLVSETNFTITQHITNEHIKGTFTVMLSDNPIVNTPGSGTFEATFKPFGKNSLTATIDMTAPAVGCSSTLHLAMTKLK
jgi:hypothetical protein